FCVCLWLILAVAWLGNGDKMGKRGEKVKSGGNRGRSESRLFLLRHHLAEFLEVDLAVVVDVDVLVDGLDVLVGERVAHALEGRAQLRSGDVSIAVHIQLVEHRSQRERQRVRMRYRQELCEVDISVVVFVCCEEHRFQLFVCRRLTHLLHHGLQLVLLDESVAVEVELLEDAPQVVVFDVAVFSILIRLPSRRRAARAHSTPRLPE
ncbi:hypothetical protein PMAYCL1PPCAC_31259, partial [Pristionchus mayeri]